MIRALLLVLLLCLGVRDAAEALPRGSAATCPVGSPSPNGSLISGPTGNGCVLVDINGNRWTFDGTLGPNYSLGSAPGVVTWGFTLNGTEVGTWARELTVNNGSGTSGTLYLLNGGPMPSADYLWLRYVSSTGEWHQVAGPTSPDLGNIFTDTTASVGYPSLYDLISNAISGHTLTVPANGSGVPAWWGEDAPVAANGTTLACTTNAIIFGGVGLRGQSQTIQNCEISYAQSPESGPTPAISLYAGSYGTLNPTLSGVYVHDSDDGILSGGYGNGTITLTNVKVQHNGLYNSGAAGNCGGNDHNIYLSYDGVGPTAPADTGYASISGGESVDVTCQGDPLKLRTNGGTVSNFTIGETGAYNDTQMNWAVDIPCGGPFTLSHMTIEHGPNAGANGVISYGEELPGTSANDWNCPPNASFTGNTTASSSAITNVTSLTNIELGAVVTGNGIETNSTIASTSGSGPYTLNLACATSPCISANNSGAAFQTTRNHTLVIDTANIIDDDTDAAHANYIVRCDGNNDACSGRVFGGVALSVTVKNSKIVVAANQSCAAGYLGPGVTDGGGNACYASRAAAGWSAYPYLPPTP